MERKVTAIALQNSTTETFQCLTLTKENHPASRYTIKDSDGSPEHAAGPAKAVCM